MEVNREVAGLHAKVDPVKIQPMSMFAEYTTERPITTSLPFSNDMSLLVYGVMRDDGPEAE